MSLEDKIHKEHREDPYHCFLQQLQLNAVDKAHQAHQPNQWVNFVFVFPLNTVTVEMHPLQSKAETR